MNSNIEPNSLAVIGAGPIGLEAALYARVLGLDVQVFEAGQICDHVRQWEQVQLFTPFQLNSSSLGLEAIRTQFPDHQFPDAAQLHSGQQWVDSYFQPLAQTDLFSDRIHSGTRVLAVGRDFLTKPKFVGQPERDDYQFRLLLENSDGQRSETFDFVIDASGTFGQPNSLGTGGIPVPGESDLVKQHLGQRIFQSLPQLDQAQIADRTVLLIGAGYSAATNAVALSKLVSASPQAKVIWLTRSKPGPTGPVKIIDNDSLPYRVELSRQANQLAIENEQFEWIAGAIEEIAFEQDQFAVTLQSAELESPDSDSPPQTIQCDLIVANTGYRGDFEMLSELQVHRCYATDGPIKFAASLMGQDSADCMSQSSGGPEVLATTEPGFFVLGSKLYGRDNRFLFTLGLEQIRDVFKVILQRDSLDLYQTQLPSGASPA